MHTVPDTILPSIRSNVLSIFALSFLIAAPLYGNDLPAEVATILSDNCTRCHGGFEPESDLSLEQSVILSQTLNQPSSQKPQFFIIKPGDPDASYLVKKITEASDITGRRMPPFNALSSEDIDTITKWIVSIEPNQSFDQETDQNDWEFNGLTIGNSPTTDIVRPRSWYFRISHRFESATKEGYSSFYGFDGPAIMMVSFGAAITDKLTMSLGRTNASDAVEWSGRYRIYNGERNGMPLSLAAQATIGWETEESNNRDRFSTDNISYLLQILLSKHLTANSIVVLIPGILVNPNSTVSNEEPLIVFGLAGKHKLGKGYSLIGDWSPIISGFASLRTTYGIYDTSRRYDSWTFGVEKITVSHVFQLFVTNAEGITGAQSLNGGDLKVQDGEMRFGFEIYRFFNR